MPTRSKIAQKLYLPDEAKPKYRCGLCEMMFYEDELDAYGRHMKECSDKNEEAVMERSMRHKFRDVLAVGDPELDAWVKEHREEILEGRKRM